MGDKTLAEKLRSTAEARIQRYELTDEDRERIAKQAEAEDLAYAERHAQEFIDILTGKAEAANEERKTTARIEWEVGMERRRSLRHTMGVVQDYFIQEGFEVNIRERDNSTPGGVRADYDFVPGSPATLFTSELTIDWSNPRPHSTE